MFEFLLFFFIFLFLCYKAAGSFFSYDIVKELHKLEKKENITIIFASDTGSRAWNCHSPQSDFDVKFIYYYNVKECYRDDNGEIKIQLTRRWRTKVIKDEDNNLDLHGWDITKASWHMQELNASIVEWLWSPNVYIKSNKLREQMKGIIKSKPDLIRKGLSSHYFGYAINRFKKLKFEKEYNFIGIILLWFNMRWLASWFEKDGGGKVETKQLIYVVRGLVMRHWVKTRLLEFELKLNLKEVLNDLYKERRVGKGLYLEIQQLIKMKQEKQKYFVPSQNLLTYVNRNFPQENANFKARIKNKVDADESGEWFDKKWHDRFVIGNTGKSRKGNMLAKLFDFIKKLI